jgi:hypothetical protein
LEVVMKKNTAQSTTALTTLFSFKPGTEQKRYSEVCPVLGCEGEKLPNQPVCAVCKEKFGMEVVNAVKLIHSRSAAAKRVNTPSVKLVPPPAPVVAKPVTLDAKGKLDKLVPQAFAMLVDGFVEVMVVKGPQVNPEFAQFVMKVAYADCPFPAILEAFPQAAEAAVIQFWINVQADADSQATIAANKLAEAKAEAERLERIERCMRLAKKVLAKLPTEAVDVKLLADQIMSEPGNNVLPRTTLIADLKAQLKLVQINPSQDFIAERCKCAVRQYIRLNPEHDALDPSEAAKLISALRPILDPLPLGSLEKAYKKEAELIAKVKARRIESYLGLAPEQAKKAG